ncbi:MAG: pantoate--beta-alanine ligase [Desulfotomaculales bacterium]
MEICRTVAEVRAAVRRHRERGARIGFVPTMGYFHEGHLSLMRRARAECGAVVVSIFVNPLQFGPREDLAEYPRDLERDLRMAREVGVDVVFAPNEEEMYPPGYCTYVEVLGLTEKLCGLSRPGHFRGVTTVVAKLFNIVQPDVAYFGQKDAQQAVVIQRMVRDLNMPLEVVVLPTVREADGLAMSSRNVYLSPEERQAALVIPRSLARAVEAVKGGERDVAALREMVRGMLAAEPRASIDYVEIYGWPDLEPLTVLTDRALLAVAVRFGRARLIDNVVLEV